MADGEKVWDEQPAVTDRPQGEPLPNTTFADRAAAAKKAGTKAVDSDTAENKSVASRKTSRKSK